MDFTVHTFWWKSVLSKSKSLSFLSAFCQAKQDSVNILTNWPIEQGGGRQVFAGFIFNRNSNFDFTLCMEESRIILHIFHVEFTINSQKYTALSPVNEIPNQLLNKLPVSRGLGRVHLAGLVKIYAQRVKIKPTLFYF